MLYNNIIWNLTVIYDLHLFSVQMCLIKPVRHLLLYHPTEKLFHFLYLDIFHISKFITEFYQVYENGD